MSKRTKKILALLLILGLLAIALGLKNLAREARLKVPEGYHEKVTLHADVSINFVFVGFEQDVIQPELFLNSGLLPETYKPTDSGKNWVFDATFFEYQQFDFSYNFVFAPDVFAEALFGYANQVAEMGPPTEYLLDYDEESGQNRLEEGEDIQYVNVTDVEDWVDANRAKYGLVFEKPEYTLFYFDSFSKGYMPTDTYHYWKFYEERYRPEDMVTDMQAWGGNYGFLWLDTGAAPSEYRSEDSAEAYPPIWHYDETTWDDFNGVLVTTAKFAVQYRFIPTFIYHPVNKPIYISSHIWVEDRSVIPPGFEEDLDFDEILERLRTGFMPWLEWRGDHITYYLPDDDPGMDETLRKARYKSGGLVYLDAKTVMNYIERNREKYDRSPEGFYNIWVNLFVLQGVEGFEAPITYGIAVGTPDGKGWGVLGTINDWNRYDMEPGRALAWFETLLVHEPGHIISLRHPHDGVLNENDTYEEGPIYWLWDQSGTIMSYRVTTWGGDQLDRDHLARGHTMLNVQESNKNLDIVYENLRAKGAEWVSGALLKKVRATNGHIKVASDSFRAGYWSKAVTSSYKALEDSCKALNLSGGITYKTQEISWSDTVTSTRVGRTPFYEETPITEYDYKEIKIEHGDEYAVVEAKWDNDFKSAADLFVGWNFDENTPGAVFDLEEEQETERQGNIETIIIDFDDSGLREAGRIYTGMGFYDGVAIALTYDVKLTIFSRMNFVSDSSSS